MLHIFTSLFWFHTTSATRHPHKHPTSNHILSNWHVLLGYPNSIVSKLYMWHTNILSSSADSIADHALRCMVRQTEMLKLSFNLNAWYKGWSTIDLHGDLSNLYWFLCKSYSLHFKVHYKWLKTSCKVDNVIGDGSNYDNAYWEIRSIRTYLSVDAVSPTSSASSGSGSGSGATSSAHSGPTAASDTTNSANFLQSSIFSWIFSLLLLISVIGLY